MYQIIHPISLVTRPYKIISKVLSIRLKKFSMILLMVTNSPSLRAKRFLTAYWWPMNVWRNTREKEERRVVKIDLEKAYEKADCDF